ncbi:unnamed protein product [Linum trigynum]
MAVAKRVSGRWSVEEAEALAAEFGAQVAYQNHVHNPVLEIDNQTIVEKITRAKSILSEPGTICRSTRRYLSLMGLRAGNMLIEKEIWQHMSWHIPKLGGMRG